MKKILMMAAVAMIDGHNGGYSPRRRRVRN